MCYGGKHYAVALFYGTDGCLRSCRRADEGCNDGRSFNKGGLLTLGFNGSLYMVSPSFLPIGLSADAPQDRTSKKVWEGEDFLEDYAFYE